jgi:hypothetical protein
MKQRKSERGIYKTYKKQWKPSIKREKGGRGKPTGDVLTKRMWNATYRYCEVLKAFANGGKVHLRTKICKS